MTREEKLQQIELLRGVFQRSSAAFMTGFSGLTVEQLNKLRNELRKQGTGYQVVKNTLAKKALEGMNLERLFPMLQGPTAMAFTADDPSAPAKVLKNFAKENEKLVLKGGYLQGQVFGAQDIERISSLPGKDEMRAILLGVMTGVPRGLLTLFNEVPASFVRLIDARREDQEKKAGEGASA